MNARKKATVSANLVRITLLVVVGTCILAGGCGNKMAVMQENQLRLQAVVEMNAHQISQVAKQIEANQQTLQMAIDDVRTNTKNLASDIASVVGEQARLRESVVASDTKTNDRIAAVEDKQTNLHSLTVAAAADITALGETQAKLADSIETNKQTLSDKISTIEFDQQRLQTEIENAQAGTARVAASLQVMADAQVGQTNDIESVRGNVRTIAEEIATLARNLAKMQEVFERDTQNLADVVAIIGQNQMDFESRVERDFSKLTDSVAAIEKNQAKLAEQTSTIRTSTKAMIEDLASTLEKLKVNTFGQEVAKPPKVAKTETITSKEPNQ